MEQPEFLIDYFGNEVRVGDIVMKGSVQSQSLNMQLSKVLQIREGKVKLYHFRRVWPTHKYDMTYKPEFNKSGEPKGSWNDVRKCIKTFNFKDKMMLLLED